MSQYPTKLSQLSNLIEHVAETAAKVIPRISAYKPGVDEACIPFIDDFVLYVTIRSYTTVPELMMSLIYLSWFRNRLPPSVTGRSSTPHRVFLAALMLAHKVHNDDSANNTCWADLSVIPECSFAGFSKVEVNLMERQFLAGLDWNLHINVDVYDLLSREAEGVRSLERLRKARQRRNPGSNLNLQIYPQLRNFSLNRSVHPKRLVLREAQLYNLIEELDSVAKNLKTVQKLETRRSDGTRTTLEKAR
ncbi:Cyclin [Pyrenophora tritici-repentis]|uniref:Cyclin n=2 Tax=Pyrenophora tritici-repentis TaxID=45151 RepID=A0A2W1FCR4_9PLEO|nr:Cyclin [Pyrenophora tritici-repentis]KAI1508920.1 Cyclin [Pyrenophora tritici-repentis]PZD22833.1 cyclin [Pyrenophora tritici-repentis]PZD32863.1 cyclin [Pyrenophora tritici-repentis]